MSSYENPPRDWLRKEPYIAMVIFYIIILFFVCSAVAFCVGAILGGLWRGRLRNLVQCTGGLGLVCAIVGLMWFGGGVENLFRFWWFVIGFAGTVAFVGIRGAMAGRRLKVWLRNRNAPPAPPVLPANT